LLKEINEECQDRLKYNTIKINNVELIESNKNKLLKELNNERI
jgi:hypothetical protein